MGWTKYQHGVKLVNARIRISGVVGQHNLGTDDYTGKSVILPASLIGKCQSVFAHGARVTFDAHENTASVWRVFEDGLMTDLQRQHRKAVVTIHPARLLGIEIENA